MKTVLDPRHQRREKIVQELFSYDAQKKLKAEATAPAKQLHDAKSVAVFANLAEIDKIISASAPEWEIDKINQIDLAVLRLAVYELVFERTEPPKVIIDEAIELAKQFGSENSPAFINGALGKALFAKARIYKIIAEKLGVEEEHLTPQSRFRQDLNATDLEVADLFTTVEDKFEIRLEKGADIKTVQDLEDAINDQN